VRDQVEHQVVGPGRAREVVRGVVEYLVGALSERHKRIGFVTPNDDHERRGEAIRKARQAGLEQGRLRRRARHRAEPDSDTSQGPADAVASPRIYIANLRKALLRPQSFTRQKRNRRLAGPVKPGDRLVNR